MSSQITVLDEVLFATCRWMYDGGMLLYHAECKAWYFRTSPGMTSGNVASGEAIHVLRMCIPAFEPQTGPLEGR